MKYFFIVGIFFSSMLFSSNFLHKEIIKLEQEENFQIIDLNQNVIQPNLDEQRGLFDSSTLVNKKASIVRDDDLDFAIVLSFRQNFAYALDGFNVGARDFSTLFAQNLIANLRLNFINSDANALYENLQTLALFSSEDSKLLSGRLFLKKEEDRSQVYTKFTDYIVVVNLDEFYVNIRNFLIGRSKHALARVNFKIISTSNAHILTSKNVRLNFSLSASDTRINYEELIKQMPNMLADVINEEIEKLNLLVQK